jgi:hypothetical protein
MAVFVKGQQDRGFWNLLSSVMSREVAVSSGGQTTALTAVRSKPPSSEIVATNTPTLRGASLLFVYAPAGALTKL